MKKNIIILLINGLLCLCSCGDFWAKTGQDTGQITGESNHDPLTQSSSEADYLEKLVWEGAHMRYGEELTEEQ